MTRVVRNHGCLIAVDPVGATFDVWQHGAQIGMQRANEPGSVGWNQCMSRDPGRARTFYADAFDYSYTPLEGGADCATINGDGPGNTVGGMGGLPSDAPPDTPAAWQTYFTVADADAAVATIRENGGRVIPGPDPTPFGRMADAVDPHGAALSLAEVTNTGS